MSNDRDLGQMLSQFVSLSHTVWSFAYMVMLPCVVVLLWQMVANKYNSRFKPSIGLQHVRRLLENGWELLGLYIGKLLNLYEWYIYFKDMFEPLVVAIMDLLEPLAYISISWFQFLKGFCMQQIHIVGVIPYIMILFFTLFYGDKYVSGIYKIIIYAVVIISLIALLAKDEIIYIANGIKNNMIDMVNYYKITQERSRIENIIHYGKVNELRGVFRKYNVECHSTLKSDIKLELKEWFDTVDDTILQ